ncbi:MAG: hypothetical protein AAF639_31685 [Chloroflexota bacterium]
MTKPSDRLSVSTLVGNGIPGYSDQQINNPYGVIIGPDGALYFCDLDNQRVRRFDFETGKMTTVAGNGQRGYSGDGGPATEASLNMPHEIQFDSQGHLYIVERDNHVVRQVWEGTGIIYTYAGTGEPGFSGDGRQATSAQLCQPHSIIFDIDDYMLICDIGNHRIRYVDPYSGVIGTFAGTGAQESTPDGVLLEGVPLNGPRTMVFDFNGSIYLALREGNAIYRIDVDHATIHHLAGTGEKGYSGDGGPAKLARLAGPKGLAYGNDGTLYVVDTENHVIRAIDLDTNIITTVLGTGEPGDGPEPDPLQCRMVRPHGAFVDEAGTLYVGDSEAHRIRQLR